MKKNLISFLFVFSFLSCLFGQSTNIGIPEVIEYSKQTYNGGTQTWEISQDSQGRIYFANNEGLLQFNGVSWHKKPLPNETIVRSCQVREDGRIYVGGQDEFGWFEANETGQLVFFSLKQYIPKEHRQFEDVWDIVLLGEEVLMRASNKIYQFKSNLSVVVHQPGNDIFFLGRVNNRIFIHDLKLGLMEWQHNKFVVLNSPSSIDTPITSILDWSTDTILFTSLKNGIFSFSRDTFTRWLTPIDNFLEDKRIYTATIFGQQQIALGTSGGGVLILNDKKQVLQHLTKKEGLQNNNILSLKADQFHNLWLGLDNGIDYAKISSPFSYIFPDGNLEGTAYSVKVFQNNIYFGTNNGLYAAQWKNYYNPFENQKFRMIRGTQGQVWGLDIWDNQLFLGHHEGAFLVNNTTVSRLSNVQGAWTFVLDQKQPNNLLTGSYQGLSLLEKKEEQSWQYLKELEGLEESCRLMVQDPKGWFWIAHPYRGIYKVDLDRTTQNIQKTHLYKIEDGHPSNVFKVNEEVVFATKKGIAYYDETSDSFLPYEEFNNLLGEGTAVKQLIEGKDKSIWFVTENEIGVLRIIEQGLKRDFEKVVFPELKGQLVGGFEYIYPYDENNVFFGAEKGFVHYNPKKEQSENKPQVILEQVYVTDHKDSLIFGGHLVDNNIQSNITFPSHWEEFRFHYSATWFQNLQQVQYQHYMEGLEEEWSAWLDAPQKEYTNLQAGDYTFYVKARNGQGQESETISYSFEIAPPWYATIWALTLYFLLILAALAALIWIPQRKFQEERAEIQQQQELREAEHQQELAKTENQLMQTKNDMLEAQVAHQNQELSNATLHLVQKGELIEKISQTLDGIAKKTKDDGTARELRKVVRVLHHDKQLDEDWQQFTTHFNQVHNDFLNRLQEKFPSLTPKDYRLCAYLRMNLSTKEIASMMNISVRGAEISRYRLRKKLGLESGENLTEFMMRF